MKYLTHLAALVALIAGVVTVVAGSAAPHPTAHPVATVRAASPFDSCTTLRTGSGTATWTEIDACGVCTVVRYPSAAPRDRAIAAITTTLPSNSWLAVGSNWLATEGTSTSEDAAFACAEQLGGFAARLT